jgi:hypothetical protein
MGWFTSKPSKPLPIKYLIHDIQVFEVDKEYATMGESEGWLKYSGYYELNGVMHFTYDFIP